MSCRFDKLLSLFRIFRGKLYFNRWDIKIGKNTIIKGLPFDIRIGRKFTIYDKCIFEFHQNAKVRIGDHCLFSYGVLLQCNLSIKIGDNVQVGEYTSIRDTSHSYKDLDLPMKQQKDISKEITIGNDVWIGRGCVIFPGTFIHDGVIVGSNSVVKGELMKNGIYAGQPAKFIKNREDEK